MCMYLYVCVCMSVCMYVYMYTCIRLFLYICACFSMKLYIQTYLDIIHINIDKEYIYVYYIPGSHATSVACRLDAMRTAAMNA